MNARGFSEAQPRLHLRLDGGARLAAAAWVTPRPSVVIRRHRLMSITLDELVDRQMLTPVAASFLRAAVRARKSIVVSRAARAPARRPSVRALCAEIDPLEAIGTFETEYELHLHELDRHQIVHAWEARPGSGERGLDGSAGRRVHARRGAGRLLPLQPRPPDRRRGPRQRRSGR